MPRIFTALAVVAAAAAAIGYNTARYPVVWEMAGEVGPLAQAGRAEDPAPSEASPEPELPEPELPEAAPSGPPVASIPHRGGADEAPLSADPPVDRWEPPAGRMMDGERQPQPAEPDPVFSETADSAVPPPGPCAEAPAFPPAGLVPVVRPPQSTGVEVAHAPTDASTFSTREAALADPPATGLRRLPPVDTAAPGPRLPDAAEDAEAIPFYPTATAGSVWAPAPSGP